MVTAHDKIADAAIYDVADKLQTAARTRQPIAPVRAVIGADNIDAAYAVQRELIDRRVAAGGVIVGRKIGLTSPAVQRQLGVDQPDFGVLLADMEVSSTGSVPSHRLLQPKVEAEIAFVLRADLVAGFDDSEHIRAAVDYAVAALEIVDSRIRQWDITIADTVADNASAGLFMLGNRRLTLDEFEPREVTMRMYVDDQLVSHGDGSACLGDPLNALAWLARAAAAYGEPLLAGQIVLSGALGPMVVAPPGTRIHAEIAPLGLLSAHFSFLEES
ncbi:2-keto-4-pentenoate hydratase [Mycobacterium florentinum]|uniref:2-keto-4-pentenoate hydratase n=1 Tax=Mycobacterium florentinum TaxID=292462 RepID=A0A1X1UL30_MYCFL|nr:fumarylacetoacetate hydrolase family protein [Mycobacterium florentinum]MCV7408182.1 fumarylacetoacetate hydrolase family protein [Mycobacterium florentinum]ORV57543.1 2-keto-4-pentenoate hydratase [Mycobacterium florentinum]BBX78589.1 putative hydratase/decarboxylase [Mycobacterium florentinum]